MNSKSIYVFAIAALLSLNSFAQGTDVSYKADINLKGYFVKAKAKAPGIVILHQWMGLTQHEKNSANKLAAMGYNALAADVYGDGKMPKDAKEAGALSGPVKKDWKLYQMRIKAAIDEVIKLGADPNKIVVIGYCFGGTGALEAARANFPVKGVVSFHGGLGKDASRPATAITPKVLVLHGADDPFEPKVEIDGFQKEMKDSKADWQMIYYANAVHAFTQPDAGNDNSKGAAYNAVAAARSWEHMKLFLNELFK